MLCGLRHPWLVWLLVATPAVALTAEGDFKKSQYYRGITAHHVVTDTLEADVDGDGQSEVLICYREPEDAVDQQGGVLILQGESRAYRVAWHAMFEKAYPVKVKAAGRALTFSLVLKGSGEEAKLDRTLVKGKDFFFRDEDESPFAGVKVKATSTLKQDGVRPENIFDRNLKTGWAEGADGTGVDEGITLEFAKPANMALIGVLHGNYRGKRYWLENNRLHRAEVTVETKADRYDTDSDVDFSQDLGLGLYGDRVELSFTNRPIMRYFELEKRQALSLEIKITSVLLGEKYDDTYLTEVDLVELVPSWMILGKPKPAAKGAGSGKPAPEEEPEDDWTDDF